MEILDLSTKSFAKASVVTFKVEDMSDFHTLKFACNFSDMEADLSEDAFTYEAVQSEVRTNALGIDYTVYFTSVQVNFALLSAELEVTGPKPELDIMVEAYNGEDEVGDSKVNLTYMYIEHQDAVIGDITDVDNVFEKCNIIAKNQSVLYNYLEKIEKETLASMLAGILGQIAILTAQLQTIDNKVDSITTIVKDISDGNVTVIG